MRQQIIAGNWKMHGSISEISTLLQEIISLTSNINNCPYKEYLVIPPAIYIPLVQNILHNYHIKWGAQNVYPQTQGAITGELSGPMLKDYQCSYVLVGHSERRQIFKEDAKFIADKFHHVKEHGMIPILCIGESSEERAAGKTEEVLTKQLLPIINGKNSFKGTVVAYEPVWAIGSGKAATPAEVQAVHAFIRALIRQLCYNKTEEAEDLPILYGGSLNENNACSLLAMPDVDGGLIGGASLAPQKFADIIKCIN